MHSKPLFVIIFNTFQVCDGLKAVSLKTPPILFSVFFSIIPIAVTTYGVVSLVLNESPFILIVMCLWCNRTIFRVKNLNRTKINTKVGKGTSHNVVWTIILLFNQNHGMVQFRRTSGALQSNLLLKTEPATRSDKDAQGFVIQLKAQGLSLSMVTKERQAK